ncbi:MAG TPA: hypothetical protein VFH61_01835 [Thermoleophilia bacterium]|nr:hypothetical protein [Thermoleophilia bacterium]
MSVGAEKTVGVTPAEHADMIQGRRQTQRLAGFVGTVATGILASVRVDRPMKMRRLHTKLLTTGSATQTDVDVKVIRAGAATAATALNATLDTINTDADGIAKSSVDWVTDADNLEPGDIVLIEVTAAPTAGVNLHAQVDMDERYDAPVERALLGP